jgi:hypothetical protein
MRNHKRPHFLIRLFIPIFLLLGVIYILFIYANYNDSNRLRFRPRPTPIITNQVHGDLSSLDHVVIVAGHAVLRVDNLYRAEWSDDAWYLLSYQKNR